MTARQIVAVGLRLFALWLCLAAFQLFWTAHALKKMTAEWGNPSLLGLSLVGLFIAVAAIVWVMSGPLSRWLVSGLGKMENVKPSTVDLLAVGCMLMGLWWLKEALLPLIRLWINAVAFASESGESAFRSLAGCFARSARPWNWNRWSIRNVVPNVEALREDHHLASACLSGA